MVRVASCFGQVLSLVDRSDFEGAIRRHKAEKGVKGFSCRDQCRNLSKMLPKVRFYRAKDGK